ncbi:hypothetical protein MAPG_00454 [Magnaporthiopsis poae ATCC 64411]|uniref:Amidase domain-containing protein n=1 Tax=Magnaporthiopsis poae (strain ATCC 64411 / 73-15) TaxID=644358 RepID=A0A0C4DL20_MAGP6|nr:hypothetical protein MAPG_00454 [Magnaporthiopsis poae ATCC 64411]
MASSFSNYPVAEECPHTEYKHEPDNNPVLRGLPLTVASTLVNYSPYLQRFFWTNAKFGTIRHIASLNDVDYRFQPNVVPLPEAGVTPATAAELTAIEDPAHPPSDNRWLAALQQHDNEDEVLADARASTARWAAGKPLGRLDGVPFGAKCDTDVTGYVSTYGMRPDKRYAFFRKVADKTLWPVLKLKEAGAIMVGHMNMHEVGMDTTGCNPAIGTPVNWYNKSYYPGGSSSGAGSSIGAGVVPIAVGTDAGGSIRIPSSYNGVYGLKVTHHRTLAMNSSVCVTGPLAATVADLALAYRVMAQPNPECPIQSQFAPPYRSSAVAAAAQGSHKKVLGICREWVAVSDPVVREHFDAAVEHLRTKAGYEVVDIKLPYLREGQLAHAATCLSEAANSAHARVRPGEGHWTDLIGPANRVLLTTGQHAGAIDYLKYAQMRELQMRHLAFLFAKHPGLLVVTPTTPKAGWKAVAGDEARGFNDGNRSILNMTYIWLANTTGCPSVSAPMGYADPEQGEGRVPLGIMAMGRWGAEEQVLDWAGDVEAYINGGGYEGGRVRPAGWVDVLKAARENMDKGKDGSGETEA